MENEIALAIVIAALVVVAVLYVLLRGVDGPLKTWYFALVKRSHAVGKTHPILLFRPIDALYTAIYEAIIVFVVYLWGLGFLPCAIAGALFLIYRVFFYKQFFTSAFVGIFHDKRSSRGDKATDMAGLIFLLLLVVIILVPILNLVAKAFSNGALNSQVTFVPMDFTFYAFGVVFQNAVFWRCFLNSVIITVVVTLFSNVFMGMAGYCLSKKDFPLRNFLMIFFVVTMLFSAGIIPIYLWMRQLNLLDSIASVILISINNVFNMLLYKTAFENVPTEIEESAVIDGCTPFQMFFRIMLPMILPTAASCAFFSIVGTWNGYGAALMFITKEESMPLSLYIYRLLQNAATNITDATMLINYQNIQAASIIISVIPILLIYPYVIRYIKSGITIGSVKG